MSNYLAIDLGAESGRVIFGQLKAGKFTMKEVHRFSNGAITANGTLRWDIIRIFREIRIGLAKGGVGADQGKSPFDRFGLTAVEPGKHPLCRG